MLSTSNFVVLNQILPFHKTDCCLKIKKTFLTNLTPLCNFYREEIKANEEPFEKERALVATLIVYCQKLDPNLSDPGSDENGSSKNSSIEISDDMRPAAAPENCTMYRKTNEDDILFAGVKKNKNSNKKSAKPKKQKVRLVD